MSDRQSYEDLRVRVVELEEELEQQRMRAAAAEYDLQELRQRLRELLATVS